VRAAQQNRETLGGTFSIESNLIDQPPALSRSVPWARLVGEFIVIVAGVLAALAADSWNDSRLERRDEAQYLVQLHAELVDDTLNFRFILDWIDRKELGLQRLDAVLSSAAATFDPDTVLADLTAAPNFGWNVGPLAGEATFEDLRSSGKLGLISNRDLRAQIIKYYEEAESEDRRLQARRTPYPALSYQLVRFRRERGQADELAVSDDVGTLLEELRRSELPSYVLAESNRASFTRASITGMQELAVRMLNAIAEELSVG